MPQASTSWELNLKYFYFLSLSLFLVFFSCQGLPIILQQIPKVTHKSGGNNDLRPLPNL